MGDLWGRTDHLQRNRQLHLCALRFLGIPYVILLKCKETKSFYSLLFGWWKKQRDPSFLSNWVLSREAKIFANCSWKLLFLFVITEVGHGPLRTLIKHVLPKYQKESLIRNKLLLKDYVRHCARSCGYQWTRQTYSLQESAIIAWKTDS